MLLRLQDFFTLFLGLIVESTPFIVLGVIVSVFIALFLKEEKVFQILPKNKILSRIILSISGILMPVCECGNIPVVRRLMLKGFDVSHAVTFMLAAPILNPITAWSTYEAFQFDTKVLIFRLIGAFVISNTLGFIISLAKDQNVLLTKKFYSDVCDYKEHHHKHDKLSEGLEIFNAEFITMMKMMFVGALIAAFTQTFIPRDIIVSIGSNMFLSIIAMILLSFIVSICANIDAFFALSFLNTFTIGSIVSFLIFGPMVDIKLLTMLRTTFTTSFLLFLVVFVTLSSIIFGLLYNIFYL